jgi:hypothetical protein
MKRINVASTPHCALLPTVLDPFQCDTPSRADLLMVPLAAFQNMFMQKIREMCRPNRQK